VYAAGDIAFFPYRAGGGHGTRIEHWDVAIDQGRVAARNMLGGAVAYDAVPFFWTSMYGKSLRYAGHSLAADNVIIQGRMDAGAPAESRFLALFVSGGAVAAVASFNEAAGQADVCRRTGRCCRAKGPDWYRW
jgi:NADPH-dependent 2,4-dienoyl-CoA reductase/sulfur reductase-like enzyme